MLVYVGSGVGCGSAVGHGVSVGCANVIKGGACCPAASRSASATMELIAITAKIRATSAVTMTGG
ncbi:hypothetical protein [uncultured Oscillibacter sp.]|uniref:hypothetical protein n=1 Tax=uncultured Oscillibacter sp. TaxID=876091 RepID=UPI00266F2769|nr:hypothetical protein [uncultured Oscillibacter sp.]